VNVVTEVVVGAVYLAILYALVRPGSPASAVVKTISSALVAVVGSATGYNQTEGSSNG
jgi:hypothetical protein